MRHDIETNFPHWRSFRSVSDNHLPAATEVLTHEMEEAKRNVSETRIERDEQNDFRHQLEMVKTEREQLKRELQATKALLAQSTSPVNSPLKLFAATKENYRKQARAQVLQEFDLRLQQIEEREAGSVRAAAKLVESQDELLRLLGVMRGDCTAANDEALRCARLEANEELARLEQERAREKELREIQSAHSEREQKAEFERQIKELLFELSNTRAALDSSQRELEEAHAYLTTASDELVQAKQETAHCKTEVAEQVAAVHGQVAALTEQLADARCQLKIADHTAHVLEQEENKIRLC